MPGHTFKLRYELEKDMIAGPRLFFFGARCLKSVQLLIPRDIKHFIIIFLFRYKIGDRS